LEITEIRLSAIYLAKLWPTFAFFAWFYRVLCGAPWRCDR
jgi:hypothetical protein